MQGGQVRGSSGTVGATGPDDGPAGAAALALVARAEEQARRLGRPDAAARLARERQRAGTPDCTVLIVGEFKKGKSSLVNALLNTQLCPVDADIATAVPTALRYGPEVRAAVRPAADADADAVPPAAPVPLEAIGSYATGGRPDRHGMADPVGTLEITVPRQLLATGLVLVDTPGVGGGLSGAHAAATLRALARADAAIFVTDAAQELTAAELRFLREVLGQCPIVICALTKTDFYPEWPRILELDRGHLRRAGLELEVLALSAPLRHEGLASGEEDLIRDSGYPRLAAFLRDSALRRTSDLLSTAALSAAREVLAQLLAGTLAQREALRGDASSAALLTRLERAKQETDRLRGGSARWQQMLVDRVADMVSNVDLDLARRIRGIRREAAERINTGSPAAIWAEIEAWVYQATNEQVLGHYRGMREEADVVVHEVARQYGIAVGDLTRELRLPDSGALDDVIIGPLQTERSTWVERGLVALRGSSGGAIVTHAAAVIFTLPVLTFTLPVTAVLGAVLARKALSSIKENELRSSRIEAVKAVNAFLDDTELLTRKDSRDTLRRISQGLRDHFSERATELHVAAAQNLELVVREVQADRDTRATRDKALLADQNLLGALLAEVDALLPAGVYAGARSEPVNA